MEYANKGNTQYPVNTGVERKKFLDLGFDIVNGKGAVTERSTLKTVPYALYEGLKADHEGLKAEHEALKVEHEGLKAEHEGLKAEHEARLSEGLLGDTLKKKAKGEL
jgi:hypothetical protein